MSFGKRSGLGLTHTAVLEAVAGQRADTLPEIRKILKTRLSGDAVAGMLLQLVARDYLVQVNGGRYALTAKGWRSVPSVQAPIEMTRYVPPSFAPARAGAMDFARYPSVAAGQRRPYHAEGIL